MKAFLLVALSTLPLLLACPSEPQPVEAPPPTPTQAAPAPPAAAPPPQAAPTPEPALAAPSEAPPTEAAEPAAAAANGEAPSPTEAAPAAAPDTTVKNPYAFPTGGAEGRVADKLETARQLVDRMGMVGLEHVARMEGRAPDGVGEVEVDPEAEKARYVSELETNYRELRRLMGDVAKCEDADPNKPTMNARSAASRILEEIERYKNDGATSSAVSQHVNKLKPIIVDLKAAHVDTSALSDAMGEDPNYSVPQKAKDNWCAR